MNETIVDDSLFDKWCTELVELQSMYPEISSQADLSEDYKEFDGSTGFNLRIGDPWVSVVWNRLRKNNINNTNKIAGGNKT